MTIVAQIKDTIQYIEKNLQTSIILDKLSSISGFSPFQLIRLFDRFTGMSPIAYIRGRRLAESLPQLLAGDTVLTVALDWGFEYEQSYIRAFREAYGITPARFRRQGGSVEIVKVPNLDRFTVSADGMMGDARLLVRPAFTISGEEKRYHYLDNLLRGKSLLEGVANCTAKVYTAACRSATPRAFAHQYLVQSEVDSSNPVEWRFPSGQWASFDYTGLHPLDEAGATRIRLLMTLVIGNWFADNGLYWDGNFTETVQKDRCNEKYCEVNFCCFTKTL